MSEQNQETTNGAPKGETYSLTLTGGGLSVNREIDEATAFQIVAVVMGGATLPRVSSAGSGGARVDAPLSGAPVAGRLSLREHMDEFEPKRNPDKILTIAAYLADTRGLDTFTPDEVKKEFRTASEPVPANYARDWNWAVANGWIAKADGEPGEYYITQRGREALTQKFSDEVKKATKQGSRRRRTRKKGDAP
jgi:hypothetical protein